jgi:hypothetical protein
MGLAVPFFAADPAGGTRPDGPANEPSTPMILSFLIKFPLIFISGIFVPLQ